MNSTPDDTHQDQAAPTCWDGYGSAVPGGGGGGWMHPAMPGVSPWGRVIHAAWRLRRRSGGGPSGGSARRPPIQRPPVRMVRAAPSVLAQVMEELVLAAPTGD